jgi:hypothetical protein
MPIRSIGIACPSSDLSAFVDHRSVVATTIRRPHCFWPDSATKESISSLVKVVFGE